jgi:hypothetical protein
VAMPRAPPTAGRPFPNKHRRFFVRLTRPCIILLNGHCEVCDLDLASLFFLLRGIALVKIFVGQRIL